MLSLAIMASITQRKSTLRDTKENNGRSLYRRRGKREKRLSHPMYISMPLNFQIQALLLLVYQTTFDGCLLCILEFSKSQFIFLLLSIHLTFFILDFSFTFPPRRSQMTTADMTRKQRQFLQCQLDLLERLFTAKTSVNSGLPNNNNNSVI